MRDRQRKGEEGFSLIELLVVIAIIGILSAMVSIGTDLMYTQRMKEASSELYANLHKIRRRSMTEGDANGIKMFGIRFESTTSYTLFEFADNNDFTYAGVSEEANTISTTLPGSVELKIKVGAALNNPNNDILIYDNLGLPRTTSWGLWTTTPFVVQLKDSTLQKRCLNLGLNKIREGNWNGTVCQEQ